MINDAINMDIFILMYLSSSHGVGRGNRGVHEHVYILKHLPQESNQNIHILCNIMLSTQN